MAKPRARFRTYSFQTSFLEKEGKKKIGLISLIKLQIRWGIKVYFQAVVALTQYISFPVSLLRILFSSQLVPARAGLTVGWLCNPTSLSSSLQPLSVVKLILGHIIPDGESKPGASLPASSTALVSRALLSCSDTSPLWTTPLSMSSTVETIAPR